jgi:arsenite methyltransferase
VVISNCVLNLSPDKPQVWREIARVLKLGGRVAVSDLALLKPLPPAVVEMVEALLGCVAGAALVEENERMIREAGLTDIRLEPKPEWVRTMSSFQDPLDQNIAAHLPEGTTPADCSRASISARENPRKRHDRGTAAMAERTSVETNRPLPRAFAGELLGT